MYHDPEDLLGKWFAANPEKRGSIFLATKFGYRRTAKGRARHRHVRPSTARQAIERSLTRLGTPYVDLLLPAPARQR